MVAATQHHASSFPFLRTLAHYLKSSLSASDVSCEARSGVFGSAAGWAAALGSRSMPAAPRHTLPALPHPAQSQGQVRAPRVPQLLALATPSDGACAARQTFGLGCTWCLSPAAACPSRSVGQTVLCGEAGARDTPLILPSLSPRSAFSETGMNS